MHSKQTLKLIEAAAKKANIFADLILANDLESGALVQVLINPEIEQVFNAVLDAESEDGKELLSLRASKFFQFTSDEDKVGTSFQELQAMARSKGHVALGILKAKAGGVLGDCDLKLNPKREEKFELGLEDRIVVIGSFQAAYSDS